MRAIFASLALCLVCAGVAGAQTVRFETSVGDFDMVLNPTNNADLQPLVDNMIAYIGLGRYHFSAINRAVDSDNTDPSDDFVLQMGGFMGFPRTPDLWASMLTSVESFDGVVVDANGDGQVDFNTSGLTNTRGTVSLALAAGNPNSGTSSFFVNLGNNSFLDSQGFVPFAQIEDLSTVETIMGLMQQDLSNAAGQPGSLAFIDVPVTEDGRIVVVERVSVVEAADDFSFVGPIATALDLANRDIVTTSPSIASEISSLELASTDEAGAGGGSAAAVSGLGEVIPEPTAAALLALAVSSLLASHGRRR